MRKNGRVPRSLSRVTNGLRTGTVEGDNLTKLNDFYSKFNEQFFMNI